MKNNILSGHFFFLPKNPFLGSKIKGESSEEVPANKFLFAGTLPANNLFLKGKLTVRGWAAAYVLKGFSFSKICSLNPSSDQS